MTLSKKLIFVIFLLLISIVIVAGVSLSGLHGLAGSLERTRSEFTISREIYEVSFHIAVAQSMLSTSSTQRERVLEQLDEADAKLANFYDRFQDTIDDAVGREKQVVELVAEVRTDLQLVREEIVDQVAYANVQDRAFILSQLNTKLNQLNQVLAQAQTAVDEAKLAATKQRNNTIQAVTAVSIGILIVMVVLSILIYRSVTRPLKRLRTGVEQMASADFETKLDEHGDAEFAELAKEFNNMGSELHTLYRDLEEQVAQKSREVVQRERLASMGFFAAGVAHEINNPLGVISGHAELSLRKLDRGADKQAIADTEESLLIIRDEAFRCKSIIEKLLDLSRMGDEAQGTVNLLTIAKSVERMITGLRKYEAYELSVNAIVEEPHVLANEGELKQVVLNLVVNAFDASEEGGKVNIEITQVDEMYQLAVIDEGKGMDAMTIEKIFEPFFTTKKGRAGASGSGLGLSISHAIVQNCGGSISVTSEGFGKGSRFVVQLPMLKESNNG